ncbi:hypothetical protein [Micromonospora sp. RTP1Z1]|uniref:hypothetical protein n=1 Tax=Micromonospora sp. RTP1Z1 TaxID=2994043 RepID=UPI0029C7EC0B|nr:hypothetical protein [Micromonospora sp. RTP1Z1]
MIFVDAAVATLPARAAAAAPAGFTLTGSSKDGARTLHLTGANEVPGLTLLWPDEAAGSRTSEAAA